MEDGIFHPDHGRIGMMPAQDVMLLYHINLGYPLLNPKSRIVKGEGGGYSIHTKG